MEAPVDRHSVIRPVVVIVAPSTKGTLLLNILLQQDPSTLLTGFLPFRGQLFDRRLVLLLLLQNLLTLPDRRLQFRDSCLKGLDLDQAAICCVARWWSLM